VDDPHPFGRGRRGSGPPHLPLLINQSWGTYVLIKRKQEEESGAKLQQKKNLKEAHFLKPFVCLEHELDHRKKKYQDGQLLEIGIRERERKVCSDLVRNVCSKMRDYEVFDPLSSRVATFRPCLIGI